MAPSRIEDNQIVDFEAPLKAAPKLIAPEPGTRQSIAQPAQSAAILTNFPHRTLSRPRIRKSRPRRRLRRLSKPTNLRHRTQRTRPGHPTHHRASLRHKTQDSSTLRQRRRRQIDLHDYALARLCAKPRQHSRDHGHGYLRALDPQNDGCRIRNHTRQFFGLESGVGE